jgi:molybdopterin synthase sulfur carrier subunit
MQIKVKFFASLAEQTGQTEITVAAQDLKTVRDVWGQATGHQALPDNTLCAINMTHANFDDAICDGDEIAFFPPVTGGT